MGIEGPYVPAHCVWELTLRCNMRCLHCGSRAGRARADELSVEECFRVGDDLAALGCRQVTFIGGEVFLYPGWNKPPGASPAWESRLISSPTAF